MGDLSVSSQRPTADVQQQAPGNSGGAPKSDQAEQAQAANAAKEAQRAQAEQAKLAQKQEQPSTLSFEFMNVFETVFQEGYENYKVPHSSEASTTHTQTQGQDLQRDMAVIREFFREANRLLAGQKLEISQMLNALKADHGGVLWTRLQQVLQKGIPVHQAVIFQKTDKDAGDIKHKFGSPEMPVALGDKAADAAAKAQLARPGAALMELLRSEANPMSQMEHAVLALQIMAREGMTDSSQKMFQYLKKRYGFTDEQMQRFLSDHKIPFYMGPMPPADAGEKSRGSLWYLLVSLVSVPIAMLIGLDFLWALIFGIALLGFFLILTAQKKD